MVGEGRKERTDEARKWVENDAMKQPGNFGPLQNNIDPSQSFPRSPKLHEGNETYRVFVLRCVHRALDKRGV